MTQNHPVIYLDHAATTPPAPQVIDTVAESMRVHAANPSAAYSAAGAARKVLRETRRTMAAAIGCDQNEIFFTSGGTESNNWVFHSMQGKHVVLSAMEHSSVLEAANSHGCRVTTVMPEADGRVLPASIEKALQPDTALISVQYANNETGILQPVAEIGRLARSHRVLFHCDAVQAFGHVPVSVKEIAADMLSVSAHKLYGPRGAGFLYIRSGVRLNALLAGGGQENGRRSGTENIPALAGFRVATELAMTDLNERAEREHTLLAYLTDALTGSIAGARVLGGNVPRTPGVCAMLLPGLSAEYAIAKLDLQGILVSGGAACAARSTAPSHVYTAMGLTETEAACVLRFSPGRNTTMADMQQAAQAVLTIYQENKRMQETTQA